MTVFDLKSDDNGLKSGMLEFCTEFNFTFAEQEFSSTILYAVQKDNAPLSVIGNLNKVTIVYDKKIHFFRGFGLLLEAIQDKKSVFSIEETPQFTMNGAMFDVSQGNAVPTISTVCSILRRMAMMGLNTMMLYCEDSFQVKEEPYFGYMRGKYTEEELKICDEYASLFGIEMIPCIQTLSHLIDTLRWSGVYGDVTEDEMTLLPDEERTYEIIEHLIRAATKPFSTKKIHIGMDEAFHLGHGKYFDKHGLVPMGTIMANHLARVMKIVRQLGLEPIMWSDMFFRPAAPDGDYYNPETVITDEIRRSVPKEMTLIYWDYYHFEEDTYSLLLEKHRLIGEPIFAGGLWTWTGFGANWNKTFAVTEAGLSACKKSGIKRVFATIWGDNGTECGIEANLLGLALFAEHGYAEHFDLEKLKKRFAFCTGGNFDDFYRMNDLEEIPGCEKGNPHEKNPSKYLMWQDLLTGLFDKNIEGLPINAHYEKLAAKFDEAAQKNGNYDGLFRLNAQVAKVLSIKSELGLSLTNAYQSGDKNALKEYAEKILPHLHEQVEILRKTHKDYWFSTYQVFGWDVFDMRYGSLLIRIQSTVEELTDYLSGKLLSLPELMEPRLDYDGKSGLISYANYYGKIASPSRIAPQA